MFAPEGYAPLSEIWREAYTKIELAVKYTKNTFDYDKFNSIPMLLPEDRLRRWLFQACGKHLFLSNGMNEPIRIDSRLVSIEAYYIASSTARDTFSQTIYSKRLITDLVSPEVKNNFNLCNDDLAIKLSEFSGARRSLRLLSKEIGNQDYKETKRAIYDDVLKASGRRFPDIFIDDELCRINFNLYGSFANLKQSTQKAECLVGRRWVHEPSQKSILIKNIYEMLKPFSGMALCVPEAHINKNWDEYWKDKRMSVETGGFGLSA